jgi:hypothetical protein
MAACNEIASFMLVCVPLPALVALILGPLYSVGSPWWLLLLLPATLAMFINLRPIWSGKIFTAAAPAIWCCAFCLVCGLLTAGAIAHALTPGVAICGVTFSIYFIVRFLKEELSHRR